MEAPPSVAAPAPRHRRTTSEHVADALRAAINSGQLADGEELNQVELAEHFGVSRVPVREAIRRLEAEGLIEAAAHRRAVVRGIALADILEAYELRTLVEGHLTEAAVPHVDRELIARLTQLNRAMRDERDQARWLALDTEFHAALYEPAGRPTAVRFVQQLRTRVERYVLMWHEGEVGEASRPMMREHATIVRLAREGQATAARAEVERHLERALASILRRRRAALAAV